MYNKNVNGITITVDEDFPIIDIPQQLVQTDALAQLAEGLSTATSIAQIRAAAKAILAATESGGE